jgi:hypothetical protein
MEKKELVFEAITKNIITGCKQKVRRYSDGSQEVIPG